MPCPSHEVLAGTSMKSEAGGVGGPTGGGAGVKLAGGGGICGFVAYRRNSLKAIDLVVLRVKVSVCAPAASVIPTGCVSFQ